MAQRVLRVVAGIAGIVANAAQDDIAAVELLAQSLKLGHCLRFQPAISQFPNAIGQPALDVGLAERRWLRAEQPCGASSA